MSEDLTRVGHVPRKQGNQKNRRKVKYVDTTHCDDHVRFRRDCHWCLVLVVEKLAGRLAELEEILHKEIEEAQRGTSRHPQRRG